MLFSLIFNSIFGTVKSIFGKIFEYPKIAIACVALCFCLYGVVHTRNIILGLEQNNAHLVEMNQALEKDKVQLRENLAAAVKVNVANQEVLDIFEVKKVDAEKKVHELEVEQKKNKETIDSIRAKILVSKPSEDGPIAKVLLNTINDIQENRDSK